MVSDRLWLVANGTCTPYPDDIETYQKMLLNAQKTPTQQEAKKEEQAAPALTPKEKRQLQASKLQAMQPIKKQINALEDKMQTISHRVAVIEKMFTQSLPAPQMVELQKELGALTKELENCENQWLELNEKLEKMKK